MSDTDKTTSSYITRGVDPTKAQVHNATKNLNKGLFPKAFCKVLPDIWGNDPSMCNIMHADTAGTKVILAYLLYAETGDLSGYRDIVEDAIVMNIDDMGAAGVTDNIVINQTISRNKNRVNGEAIAAMITSTEDYLSWLRSLGINAVGAGGETADVGDVVRTFDVACTAAARVKRSDILSINIKPGNYGVGLGSSGTTAYDSRYNGGMGSNGLTGGRHDLLSSEYITKYPEAFDRETAERNDEFKKLLYCGKYKITNPVVKLMMSPTRTYMPVLKDLKDADVFYRLSGIVHNTGGAHTKIKNFVSGIKIEKSFNYESPKIFQEIKDVGNTSWEEMFGVYNMDARMEFWGPKDVVNEVKKVALHNEIDVTFEGKAYASQGNEVVISHECLGRQKSIKI